MALTDLAVRKAPSKERPYKVGDGAGLYLLVQPNGSKHWRFKYRFAGKEKLLSFGTYPSTRIGRARERRDDARKLIENGTDPSVRRKLDRLAAEKAAQNTFADVVNEYLENLRESGAAESTLSKNKWLLEDLAAPLARRPIAEIVAAEILDILKRIEKSGRRETARRLRGAIGTVFRYGITTLRATNDPTFALRGGSLIAAGTALNSSTIGAAGTSQSGYAYPFFTPAMLLINSTSTVPTVAIIGEFDRLRCGRGYSRERL
jgi:hypothetical protein